MFEDRSSRYSGNQELAFAGARILFGVIWLINTLLEANNRYIGNFLTSIIKRLKGQPHAVQAFLHSVIHVVTVLGPRHVAIGTVVLDGLLAISLITGFAVRPMARLGILYSLALWATVGGLGGPYQPGATDPGTAIVYALVFLAVLSVPSEQRLAIGPASQPVVGTGRIEVVRILFGLLWAFDAFWKWQPAFFEHSLPYLQQSEVGQPAWIVAYIGFFISAIRFVGPVVFGLFAAVIETVLAASLLLKRWQQWFLPIGFLYSFGIWTTAEGWGGPYLLGSTANRGDMLGTTNIYMVVYLYLMIAYLFDRRRHKRMAN